MQEPLKRTYSLNIAKLDQLLAEQGLTLQGLAHRCDMDVRVLRRKRSGEPAYVSTIRTIADALDTTFSELVNGSARSSGATGKDSPTRFAVRLRLKGTLHSSSQKDYLIKLNARIAKMLESEGLTLTGQTFTATTSHFAGPGAFRLVVAISALTDNKPSWFLALIKPSMLGALDQIEQCDAASFGLGEIICSGWGQSIPADVIEYAAAILDCSESQIIDASTL